MLTLMTVAMMTTMMFLERPRNHSVLKAYFFQLAWSGYPRSLRGLELELEYERYI